MSWKSRYSRNSVSFWNVPGSDEQLPGPLRPVLDRVEKVRLAGALVSQDRYDLGMRTRRVAVQIHHAEQQLALLGVQLGDMVTGADLVVGVAAK